MTTANQLAGYASSLPSLRNLLINGAMQISQRGDVTGVTGSTYGGPDRFHHIMSSGGAAGTFSISQSTDAPNGFSKSMKISCTSSTSLGAGNFYLLSQKLEGQNVQHLEYGSSTAKSLTLSFWVKTNVAGDYAVEFQINTGAAHISKSFNISSAEASAFSWVKRKITIPGNTATSITNDNTNKFILSIWLVAGNDFTSGTLNSSAWASVTQANRALAMNLGSSTSNEFYITGVQLEEGTVGTEFEHRPIGIELSLCQRYYYRLVEGTAKSWGAGSYYATSLFASHISFPVTMRTPPDLEYNSGTDWYRIYSAGTSDFFSNMVIARPTTTGAAIDTSTGTSGTAGNGGVVATNNSSSYIAFTAEL